MITPIIIAQADLSGVPATIFKWVLIVLLGLAVAAAFIWSAFRPAPKPKAEKDKNASSRRYNHDLAEERFKEVTRRLDKHDSEILEIQKDRASALKSINRRFERVLIGITAIGARVGAKVPKEQEEEDES